MVRAGFIIFVICIFLPFIAPCYSLLTHEAIIDVTWETSLKPLLLKKYPKATEEELRKAHAYIYGGTIIPDLGYYPLGRKSFSNLLHYVRTGDFINNLFESAENINQYAFALGVLCHYQADVYGHPMSTNRSVPVIFEKLRKKYGDVVTYEQAHAAHTRVEFGFDVLMTAKGNYKSEAYHDFIGFEVNDTVLEKAFKKTYGLELRSMFTSFSAAVSIFRWSVRELLPELTKDAWRLKKSIIVQANPLATEKSYRFNMKEKNYRKEFTKPKLHSYLILLVMGILPKYGPLVSFKPSLPTDETEKLYNEGYSTIITKYKNVVHNLKTKDAAFDNVNLDTGEETKTGAYELADKTYYWLLMKLKKHKFELADDELKQNMVAYFSDSTYSKVFTDSKHKQKKIKEALALMNAPADNTIVNDGNR